MRHYIKICNPFKKKVNFDIMLWGFYCNASVPDCTAYVDTEMVLIVAEIATLEVP